MKQNLPFISHCSFLNDHSLIIENCKLKIEATERSDVWIYGAI